MVLFVLFQPFMDASAAGLSFLAAVILAAVTVGALKLRKRRFGFFIIPPVLSEALFFILTGIIGEKMHWRTPNIDLAKAEAQSGAVGVVCLIVIALAIGLAFWKNRESPITSAILSLVCGCYGLIAVALLVMTVTGNWM